MSKPWPCRMCRRDVCADCAVEPAPCEHDELCMDCWDTCAECHSVDVTADDEYRARVATQLTVLAQALAAPPQPYPFADGKPGGEFTGHRRTELLRAAYTDKRAECACGWVGAWHPYSQLDLMEADWRKHLEETP